MLVYPMRRMTRSMIPATSRGVSRRSNSRGLKRCARLACDTHAGSRTQVGAYAPALAPPHPTASRTLAGRTKIPANTQWIESTRRAPPSTQEPKLESRRNTFLQKTSIIMIPHSKTSRGIWTGSYKSARKFQQHCIATASLHYGDPGLRISPEG
jgi:hypothetical protein